MRCVSHAFSECLRSQHSSRIYNNLHSSDDIINPNCPYHTTEGKCIFGPNPLTLSDGGDSVIMDAEFNSCYNTGPGGAITQISGDLTIKRCIFDTCSCGDRGGAVSFCGDGVCTQEDNLYIYCSSGFAGGAFNSFNAEFHPHHHQQRCTYFHSYAVMYYAHFCIEFSPDIIVDSNIYIHGRSDRDEYAGTVVNFHSQGAVVYSNSLFADGKAYNSGGLSFMSQGLFPAATFSTKFCFFMNNHGKDGTAKEIYFNSLTSSNANRELIIHTFSATPGSTLYIETFSPPEQDWIPRTNTKIKLFDLLTTTANRLSTHRNTFHYADKDIMFKLNDTFVCTLNAREHLFYIPENTYEIISFYSLNS